MPMATSDVSSRPPASRIKRPVVISPVTLPSTVTRARLTRWTTARICQLQDFLQQTGQTPSRLVQFIEDDAGCPRAIQHLTWHPFFDCLASRNDSIVIQEWLHISKFQTRMRVARDRQDFVGPNFGVTGDRGV